MLHSAFGLLALLHPLYCRRAARCASDRWSSPPAHAESRCCATAARSCLRSRKQHASSIAKPPSSSPASPLPWRNLRDHSLANFDHE